MFNLHAVASFQQLLPIFNNCNRFSASSFRCCQFSVEFIAVAKFQAQFLILRLASIKFLQLLSICTAFAFRCCQTLALTCSCCQFSAAVAHFQCIDWSKRLDSLHLSRLLPNFSYNLQLLPIFTTVATVATFHALLPILPALQRICWSHRLHKCYHYFVILVSGCCHYY